MVRKQYSRKRVPKVCTVCGVDFMARTDSPGTCCSKQCRAVLGGRSVLGISKNAGVNNPNFKNGNAKTPRHKLEAVNDWEKRNPEKRRAEDIAVLAVRNGTLVRKPCVVCGALNSHGHHEDYSQPLEVIWLCPLHHRRRHKELREMQNASQVPISSGMPSELY